MKKLKFKKYRGKIGILAPFMILLIVGAFLLIWLLPRDETATTFGLKIASTCLLGIVAIILLWCIFWNYYVITDVSIINVSGPFTSRIRLNEITKIKEKFGIFSSFCFSIDRLAIYTGNGMIKRFDVSPKNKEDFINELTSKIDVEVERRK